MCLRVIVIVCVCLFVCLFVCVCACACAFKIKIRDKINVRFIVCTVLGGFFVPRTGCKLQFCFPLNQFLCAHYIPIVFEFLFWNTASTLCAFSFTDMVNYFAPTQIFHTVYVY